MILTPFDAADERLKYKVVRLDNFKEVVPGAEVVSSNDDAGSCTLRFPSVNESGHIVMGADGNPLMAEKTFQFPAGSIATVRR